MHSKVRIKTRLIAGPIMEPITLEEAKLYLRVSNNKEDSLIISLIKATRNLAENYLKVSFLTQEWQAYCIDFVSGNILLPKGPIQSIESIFTFQNNGKKSLIAPEIYDLNKLDDTLYFKFPIINQALYINYTTGCKKISDISEGIKQALKEHIAYIYDGRGNLSSIPSHVKEIYNSFRKILL
ncbi:MAG: head-tail connector protein [Alphaproteobacteria bacterium]